MADIPGIFGEGAVGATVVGEALGDMPPKDHPAVSANCRMIDDD